MGAVRVGIWFLGKGSGGLLGGELIQLFDHLCQLIFDGLVHGLETGGGVVDLLADHGAQTALYVEGDIDDTQVDVDTLGNDIHHQSRLGIGGDLGAEGLLVVDGLDDLVAGGCHGLHDRADHIQSLALNRGGDGYDGELVVEQGVVAVLLLVELRHGDDAVLLGHISHDGVFKSHDTEGRHSTLPLGEHIADVVLLGVGAVLGEDVGAVVGTVVELKDLIGGGVDLVGIQDLLQVAVGILADDVDLAGAPVGVGADEVGADEAVDIALGVLYAVTVVLVEEGDQGESVCPESTGRSLRCHTGTAGWHR